MRRYIRHPSDISIQVKQDGFLDLTTENLLNVSYGGLSFHSHEAYQVGSRLKICIPLVTPQYEAIVSVRWCDDISGGYDVGVELLSKNDFFRIRMVEQVCHIAHYRQQVYMKEGRQLTESAASLEWISKYAHEFPGLDEMESY
ncbi:MAG TPA: PilZ domain-containing protein [Gammaproteobacteria bacterium]|nr:PilZ domain-containing protein [Gammaproteobacteria bacterium]